MSGPAKSKRVNSDMAYDNKAARHAAKANRERWSIDVDLNLWLVSPRVNNGSAQRWDNVIALRYDHADGHRAVTEITLSIGPPTNRNVKLTLRKMVVSGEAFAGLDPHAALVQFADRSPPYPTTADDVERMQGMYRCQQISCRGLWL